MTNHDVCSAKRKIAIAEGDSGTRNEEKQSRSRGTIRMRRLRERRRNGLTRIVAVEVTVEDRACLLEKGFFHEGETPREHLPLALQRLLRSIR